MEARKELAILLIITLALGVAAAWYHLPAGLPARFSYTDISNLFYETQHGLPYIQSRIEYPVIVGMFMYLCARLGGGITGYYILNSALLTACSLVTVFFLYRILQRRGEKRRLIPFLLVIPTMFFFMIYNWDMISVMFSVIGIYFIEEDDYALASLFFALGFCTKFYPVLFLLPMMIKRKDRALQVVAVFVLVSLAINLPFMILNYQNWSYFYSLSSARSPNVDSIWYIIGAIVPSLQSVKVVDYLSLALVAASVVLIAALRRNETVVKQLYLILIAFIMFNKVLSPQYLLWLVPFFIIFQRKEATKSLSLQISNILVLGCILFYNFSAPSFQIQYLYATWVFVVLREVLLLWLLIHLLGERAKVTGQAKASRRKKNGNFFGKIISSGY